MDANEDDLKTTNEIASHQQLETWVLESFDQGLNNGLLTSARMTTGEARLAQAPSQRNCHQGGDAKDDQCLLPAQAADQESFSWHHQELTKRAGCCCYTHGPGAFLC